MPRRKSPKSAYYLSLHCLSDVIARACVRIDVPDIDVTASVAFISKLVKKIPTYATDEYVELVLNQLHHFKHGKYLRAALHPECTTLTSGVGDQEPDVVMTLLKNLDVMGNLKTFQLLYTMDDDTMDETAQQAFIQYLHNFHGLVSITLTEMCTSEVLKSISEFCPNLEKIRILSGNHDPQDLRLLSKCKRLKWFEVTCDKGILSVPDTTHLLDHLPDLEFFLVQDMGSVLESLALEQSPKTYGLISCGDCKNFVDGEDLEALNKYFPKLEELSFVSEGIESLCTTFVNLKRLEIEMNSEEFSDLSPIVLRHTQLMSLSLDDVSLKNIFSGRVSVVFPVLEQLLLYDCKHVYLTEIDRQCPNLDTLLLNVSISEQASLGNHKDHPAFRRLKKLIIGNGIVSAGHLLFLLSSCKELQQLSLCEYMQDEMDDDVMTNELCTSLLQKNPMKMLHSLSITSNGITKAIIPDILQAFNNLEYLSLEGMQMDLTESESEDLKRELQEFNMVCYIQGSLICRSC